MPESTPTARFCTECGSPLPAVAKFCPQCGTQVAAPASPADPDVSETAIPAELKARYDSARAELRGDRREVVVLFADMSGFTSMSERMDAEDVGFMMQGLLSELADVVYRYEGYVDKYIGDAIMALFGAPIAHENDAERAVRAALDMLEVTARLNAAGGDQLAIRVGLNLGAVVAAHVGSDSRHQYTVMGDTVNVASRLEGAAAPDSVLVSESVRDRTLRWFEFEEVPSLTVKGKSDPLRAYRVIGSRAATARAESKAPFVGREGELESVRDFLGAANRGPAGVLVIEAEAGAGKTRLVSEAVATQSNPIGIVEIDFSQLDHPGSLPVVPELFRELVTHDDGGVPDTAKELIDELGAWVDEADLSELLPGIRSLARQLVPEDAPAASASDEDPSIVRQNRWLAVASLLSAKARHSPLVLRLEDVHWAREADEEFLTFLLSRIGDDPISVIATSRLEADLAWVPDHAQRLQLQNLGESAARQILGQLFDNLRPVQRAELIRRSQGNPFYLEQLARSLQDQLDGAAISVPGTIQGLLQSRLDKLDKSVRLLLQMASILGMSFPRELLSRMYRLERQPISFESAFSKLLEQGFVDAAEGDEEARFHHALMHEVSYGSVLVRMRKVLHESAARLGEEYFEDGSETESAFFAHHFWEAGLLTEAAPHLWDSGKAAARNYELHTAEKFLERLAQISENEPEVLGDPTRRADFARVFGDVLRERGRFQEADESFQRLHDLGAEVDDTSWMCLGLFSRGAIALYQGQIDRAQTLFERGLALKSGEDRIAADLHSGLGIVHYFRNDVDGALEQHGEALRLRETAGDRFGYVKSLMNIGNIHFHLLNDSPAARKRYEQGLAIAREIGDRETQGRLGLNLGTIDLEAGHYRSALERFRDVQELAEDVGLSRLRFLSLRNQAVCDVRLGHTADALHALKTCLQQGDDVLDPSNRVAVRLLLFEAYFAALEDEGAARWLREAVKIAEQHEVEEQDDWLRLCEARLTAIAEDHPTAIAAYARAIEVADRLNEPNTAKIARAQHWRASAKEGGEDPGPFPVVPDPRPPMASLLGYLEADGRAAIGDSDRAIADLGAMGKLAEDAEDRCVARAAYQRQAELLADRGDASAAGVALDLAFAALEAFRIDLPVELLEGFENHPRNAVFSAHWKASRQEPEATGAG